MKTINDFKLKLKTILSLQSSCLPEFSTSLHIAASSILKTGLINYFKKYFKLNWHMGMFWPVQLFLQGIAGYYCNFYPIFVLVTRQLSGSKKFEIN